MSALTRISREAIESKLSDYQKESWLFLSSLELESFSFGDRLPIIEYIHMAYSKSGSLALVFDISYSGGIKVGLKAAVAMNFRDFAASIDFKEPSKFKLVLKFDAEPTPRISFMLSDLPAYEMSVAMRSQQMDRVSNLIKLLIGNFVRTRFCFPNYLTTLFHLNPQTVTRPSPSPLIQIANSKQYQSQLRVRLVSVNLNLENEAILPINEINVMAVLSLGELTCKTEIINAELRNTRWNSIHTFNVFNGLDTSPKCLQISLYQVIEDALNHLGRIEIPYPSITPGLLDIRTLSLSSDQTSTISLEMYLHHMEEDGERDANWIFWNCPKPPRRKPENEKSIEKVDWDTIKFIISKFYNEPVAGDDTNDLRIDDNDCQDANSSVESITYSETENLFDLIEALLDKSIHRLKSNQAQILNILKAFKLELEDFSARFNLKRPALSSKALPSHNDRLSSLLKPLVKSFIPEAIRLLNAIDNADRKILRDLDKIISITTKVDVEVTNDSSPDLLAETSGQFESEIGAHTFDGFFGDIPVSISIEADEGIKIIRFDEKANMQTPQFDFEGIFYKPNNSCKTFNLSSSDLFNSPTSISATWEIALHRNRFISFVSLGRPQIFPSFVVDALDILEIEVIKDRNAFNLGFNADLSVVEALKHANNGVLRLILKDEVLDLLGESRSCDQWFCILSCRLKKSCEFNNFDWKGIDKVWLLPLNLPSLGSPYTLAIRHDSQTYSFIFDPETLYKAYCRIKTLWMSKRPSLELGNSKLNLNTEISGLSLSPSITESPQSQRSSISLLSFPKTFSTSLSSSASSSALRGDPFASKTRFDRLKMSSCDKPVGCDSLLMMTSIDDLRPSLSPFKWTTEITDKSAVFNCTLVNFPTGFISIGDEYICYWSHNPKSPTDSSLLLLPKSAILDVSKSLPNWVSSFSGILLKLRREYHRGTEPIIFTGFNSKQELELVFDTLLGA